jgi:uncharacterized protein involved in type VI secretion and phage assembly
MDAYGSLLTPPAAAERFYGVAIGVVTNNKDPNGLGRVKVALPWMSEEVESDWARMATPMAGAGRGIYFLPEVGDEVLVAFEQGNPEIPYVLGGLWNGPEAPPVSNADGENNVRVIQSRSGGMIRFTDTQDSEKIEIIDASGNNTIVIDTAHEVITITSAGDLQIVANSGKGKLTLSGQNVEITAEQAVKVSGLQVGLKATGELSAEGNLVKIN